MAKSAKSKSAGLKNRKKTPAKNFGTDENGKVKPGPGRPKGTPNKTPAQLVHQILEIAGQLTLEGKGLIDCARQNPQWFFEKILARVVPKSVDIDLGASDDSKVTFEIIKRFELPGEKKDTV